MSRGGLKCGMTRKRGEYLLAPLHRLKGGSRWDPDVPFHKAHLAVLSRIGQALMVNDDVVPRDNMVAWQSVKSSLAERAGMALRDVGKAMLLLFPVTFNNDNDYGYGCSPCLLVTPHKYRVKELGLYNGSNGYTHVNLGGTHNLPAHRFVLYAVCGLPAAALREKTRETFDELMSTMHAIHLCGDKRCCNFKHLRWGTAKDNNMEPGTADRKKCYDDMYKNLLSVGQHALGNDAQPPTLDGVADLLL